MVIGLMEYDIILFTYRYNRGPLFAVQVVLSWSRKLGSLQSLYATDESVKVNAPSPSSRLFGQHGVVRPPGLSLSCLLNS